MSAFHGGWPHHWLRKQFQGFRLGQNPKVGAWPLPAIGAPSWIEQTPTCSAPRSREHSLVNSAGKKRVSHQPPSQWGGHWHGFLLVFLVYLAV